MNICDSQPSSHQPASRRASRRLVGLTLSGVMAAGLISGGVLLLEASPASAGTCNAPISSTISGTWRLHASADLNSAAVGTLSNGSQVAIDAQAMNPGGPVTVSGFGTSAVLDHTSAGWFSDLGSTNTPYQAYAPGCSGSQPPSPQPAAREQKALAWAQSEVGRTRDDYGRDLAGWCARWSVGAYGRVNSGYNTAYDMYLAFRSMGLVHTGVAPAGTFVFFAPARVNGNAGHVAIADGNNRMITTPGRAGQAISDQPLSYAGATYLGWSYAPTGWSR